MRDLLQELIIAKKKKIYYQNEFSFFLKKLKRLDANTIINWDTSAGEDWASLYNGDINITCLFHIKIGICFVICKKIPFRYLEVLKEIHCVYVNSYEDNEWILDVNELRRNVSEIFWHTDEDCIDHNNLSVMDFYWATI